MKTTIHAAPIFYVDLTLAQVTILSELALMHYDAKCNSMALVGGRIYGWMNHVKFELEENTAVDSKATVRAERGDLDLCLKIMEMPPPSFSKIEIITMSRHFRAALQVAAQKLGNIVIEVDV